MPRAIRVQDLHRTSAARRPIGRSSGGPVIVRVLLSLVIVVTGVAISAAPRSSAQAPVQVFYVQDTGHTIGGDFLEFWKANDGKDWLGLPVTEPIEENDTVIQYYELGVLISKPDEDDDTEIPVDLSPVGLELLQEQVTPPSPSSVYRLSNRIAPASVIHTADGTGIPTTAFPWPEPPADRMNLISQAFEKEGGFERFGSPITNPVVTNGEVVQWFERGRLSVFTRGNEDVRIGSLGWELALLRGIPTDPIDGGDLPLFDGIGNARIFAGDGYIEEATGPFSPVRLVSPALGIDAPIEWTVIADGVMQSPVEPMAVGWYGDISSPGTGETVIVSGHVDWHTIGPAVFYSLSSAGPGTKFYLIGPDGTGATYVFSESYMLGAGDAADPILEGTGTDSLTLITCTGGFDAGEYDSRLIVHAERI